MVKVLVCPFDSLKCGRSGHCVYYESRRDLMCHPCSRFDVEEFYKMATLFKRDS